MHRGPPSSAPFPAPALLRSRPWITWARRRRRHNAPRACNCSSWPRATSRNAWRFSRPSFSISSGSTCCRWISDRKSTRLNSSHQIISYAVFCLKKKKTGRLPSPSTFFFFNAPGTPELCALPRPGAPPIPALDHVGAAAAAAQRPARVQLLIVAESDLSEGVEVFATKFLDIQRQHVLPLDIRSEEHTSELQSPDHLVCRLLLEKKKNRPPTVAVYFFFF